ncbi:hypothetical protein FB45DRAFT_1083327 [Roridomyces roridus]|uniref:Uncharacterized protein n=1 Tax=Roridomyces roridus TaxID=1738132 RepID=A0AAD7AYC3_9AGAR|nr:hypothetical protein FB45DRAFT_1083327 [Roridomyces roridus]
MSDNSLPDEIISEILSPALQVPDEKFSDVCSRVSPFAEYVESPSAYLVVCKSWLRVATPLLYKVVVLRSKAQAKALAQVLDKNPDLGQFIRRLRLEGGYGVPMRTILASSPNISDIFVTLDVVSSDSAVGLYHGLGWINPRRLILHDSFEQPCKNKTASKLLEGLNKAIPHWERLTALELPVTLHKYPGEKVDLMGTIARKGKLQTPGVSSIQKAMEACRTFDSCPLKRIQVKSRSLIEGYDSKVLAKDPALKALVRFDKTESSSQRNSVKFPDIAPSLNRYFVPMAAATAEVRSLVWKRVLYFAVLVPGENGTYRKTRRFPILLVSKLFYKLTLPYYYAHITLIPSFAKVLERNPSIAPHIRTIRGDFCGVGEVTESPDWGATILAQTTDLEALHSQERYEPGNDDFDLMFEGGITWDAFETMARSSGSTVREFSALIRSKPSPVSPTVFAHLTGLWSLIWKSDVVFDLMGETVPSAGLPNLTNLTIAVCDASFLTVLSRMGLPSLKSVVLAYRDAGPALDFLAAHGEKIVDLACLCGNVRYNNVFELCPNIRVLTLCFNKRADWGIPKASSFTSRKVLSKTLEKLHLDKKDWTGRVVTIPKWDSFFAAITAKCFPSLREIQVDCCKWPTNERAIATNCWVRWAEMLMQEGISLSDAGGKKWRARLKVK